MNTFEVITVALCPQRHIDVFGQHYLDQGASRVRVFFDGDVQRACTDSRIEVVPCNADFWCSLGMARPFSVEDRQRAIYRHAYAVSEATFCLIVDIDEFVFGPTRLQDYLATIDEHVSAVRFTSAEATFAEDDDIYHEFGATQFRLPIAKYPAPILSRLLYGSLGRVFIRGLLGHARGKLALRTGFDDIGIGIHDAWFPDHHIIALEASPNADFWLAHFDAIDFPRWREKWIRRIGAKDTLEMGRKRDEQQKLFKACATAEDQAALFRRLYGLRNWQAGILRRLGLLKEWRGPIAPARTRTASATERKTSVNVA